MNELTAYQIQKKIYNLRQYNTRKNVYKVAYIFKTYPHIETQHAVDIKDYVKIHGEDLTDEFVDFLRTFIPPPNRPSQYVTKSRGLPKILRNIIDT